MPPVPSIRPRLPMPLGLENITVPQWRVLCDAIFPGAKTAEAIALAVDYCRARRLDPFKRPVHIVPMYSRAAGGMVETVWPGINELEVTAARSGAWAGLDEPKWGPDTTRTFSGAIDNRPVSFELTFPSWCIVTVYRIVKGSRYAFAEPVYWEEAYARNGRTELPNETWQRRIRGQLHKCYSPDTEVLTDLGFQRFDEVTGSVLQVTETGLERISARPFKQEWTGPMIVADGDTLSFCVTPNHDIITTDGKVEAGRIYETATCLPKYRAVLVAPNTQLDAPFSDRAIELAALYLTDGTDASKNGFTVNVSRQKKITKIESDAWYTTRSLERRAGDVALLGDLEIITISDQNLYRFKLSDCEGLVARGKCPNLDGLVSLSKRQAKLFIDTMLFYDGNVTETQTKRYYSSHPRILAAFELATIVAGLSVSRRHLRFAPTGQLNYSVTVGRKTTVGMTRFSPSQVAQRKGIRKRDAGLRMIESNPTGEVWCVTVPSGAIVVRRNGFSMVCGNCAKASSLRAAFPEEVGNDYAAEEMEGKDTEQFGQIIEGHVAKAESPTPEPPPDPPAASEHMRKTFRDLMGEIEDAAAACTTEDDVVALSELPASQTIYTRGKDGVRQQLGALLTVTMDRVRAEHPPEVPEPPPPDEVG